MKRILLLFIALAAVWGAAAKIRLPEIIGNDMVLQQNAEVRLWGWAEPHAAVKVETSWGAGAAVKSDADGRWAVSVRTPAGSYEPQRITFASGDRVTFDRVLIGEVWFAGGQSNMEMPLGGFWQCPVTDANEIIARAGAKSGKLHYVKIPHAAAYTPQDRTAGSWTPCTTATAAKFTAAGYFFAEMLNDVLGVPVGIIDCSWGGSRVESWMSREVLSGYSDIDLTEEGISRVAQHLRPMVMYICFVLWRAIPSADSSGIRANRTPAATWITPRGCSIWSRCGADCGGGTTCRSITSRSLLSSTATESRPICAKRSAGLRS